MSDIVERLRDHATDWNGAQMLDLEPAKGDPTAGTLREAAAEITRLRADLAAVQRERDEARELLSLFTQQANKESALKRASEAERDLAAAQEREQRMREALETARGLYQVTHIHAAIDAALSAMRGEPTQPNAKMEE